MNVRALISPVTAALFAAAATAGAMRLASPAPTDAAGDGAAVVRAQRFELVDAGGAVRGVLGMDAFRGRPGLLIVDEAGRARAFFGNQAAGNGYGLGILDERGTFRAGLGAGGSAGGFAGINVRDATGRIRANLFATDDGSAMAVQTWDEAGRVRTFMGACPQVPLGIYIFGEDGPADPCPGP